MHQLTGVAILLGSAFLLDSCARLHHTMLSDVESRHQSAERIDIKVSETTIDFKELAQFSKNAAVLTKAKNLGRLADAVDTYTMLFQFGPTTGAPVFNAYYARPIPELLQAKCTRGRLSNIVSIRETREYPIVKGEVIRIQALCHTQKG